MTTVQIGSRTIGAGAPCFLVAEMGINHNGDITLAKNMIDAAADADADAAKFQNYQTEDFISDKSLSYEYICQGKTIVESQYDMFKRCELSKDALRALKSHCDSRGILFHSTPTSEAGIKDLLELDVRVLKNGSDYLTHLPLIRAMGRTHLPTILSTGMATLAEIDQAVCAFRETGNKQLILLHCVSSYPTPSEEVHLRKIPTLAMAFGCPVGFSDHTEGVAAGIGAAALGACWIEKHFTLDKELPGPDHKFSANPQEFKALVRSIRSLEKCLGDSRVEFTSSQMRSRQEFRLSCIAADSFPAGHVLTAENIVFRRPGTDVPPALCHILVGHTLKHDISAGQVIKLEDI